MNKITVSVRGKEFSAQVGEFSDVEVGPIYALANRIGTGDFTGLAALLEECQASLRAVFGPGMDDYWRNGRPILHTKELVGLAATLIKALDEDPHYESEESDRSTEGRESSTLVKKGFGDAVRERRNTQEEVLAAEIERLQQQLKAMGKTG